MSSKSVISRIFTVAFSNKWQIVFMESKILPELTTLPVISMRFFVLDRFYDKTVTVDV
jgi:hypothetical protein